MEENSNDIVEILSILQSGSHQRYSSYDDESVKHLYEYVSGLYWQSLESLMKITENHRVFEFEIYMLLSEMSRRNIPIDDDIIKLHKDLMEKIDNVTA